MFDDIRANLKKIPGLLSVKRSIARNYARYRFGADFRICEELPAFAPYSPGTYRAKSLLTIQAANDTFPLLCRLMEQFDLGRLQVVDVKAVPDDVARKGAALKLKKLFDANGSNKASRHNYHLFYGNLLADRETVTGVLEIGLGTNHTDIVSTMGKKGIPGASVRALRDFFPNATIYGADVDKRILFTEDRIRTFFVDQTRPETIEALSADLPAKLDLIIDDGLHSPSANLAVLNFALDRIKVGGWVVIEDIPEAALPIWHVAASLLPPRFRCLLVKCDDGWLFGAQLTGNIRGGD